MSDPRLVAERCHARTTHSGDALRPSEYVCMFLAGHDGLHYSDEMWVDGHRRPVMASEVVRWGTQDQLDQETGAAPRGD